MDKKVIRVGNSFAVVIDKPVCRALGIGPGTPVSVVLREGRISIEPLPRAREPGQLPEALLGRAFGALVMELLERHDMSQEEFEKLHHQPRRAIGYALSAYALDPGSDPDEQASRRRLRACLVALRSGLEWKAAIELALVQEPRGTIAA